MMLPVDMMLVAEPAFKKWVEVYAKDEDKFFKVRTARFSVLREYIIMLALTENLHLTLRFGRCPLLLLCH